MGGVLERQKVYIYIYRRERERVCVWGGMDGKRASGVCTRAQAAAREIGTGNTNAAVYNNSAQAFPVLGKHSRAGMPQQVNEGGENAMTGTCTTSSGRRLRGERGCGNAGGASVGGAKRGPNAAGKV